MTDDTAGPTATQQRLVDSILERAHRRTAPFAPWEVRRIIAVADERFTPLLIELSLGPHPVTTPPLPCR